MKKLFLILILFSSFKSFAQSSDNIDSLVAIPYDFLVSEPNKFIHKIKEVIPIVEKAENKFIKAKLYSNLALAYSAIGELDNYRDAEIKAISIYEELNNELELTSEYGSFGYHLRRTNIERAKYYMRLAIKIGEKNKLDEKLTAIYDNYGTLLEQQGKSDSAIFYYEKGLNLKYMLSDSIGIPYSLNHLAGIYAALGSMEKAFQQMKLSDEYRAKEKNNYGRAENAVIYGELYLMTGNHTKAIAKFNESLLLAKSIGNKYMIQYNYQQLANAYEKKKDFGKAFSNLKNFITYKDSISNLEINKKIAQLEIKFESEKKDKEIANSNLKLRDQQEQIFLTISLLIILIIAFVLVYLYQRNKRKQIKKEFELLSQLSNVEYKNKISSEKLRISRELHDNIGSHLTFIISSLDNITYKKNFGDTGKLKDLSSFGRKALNELRETIWMIKGDDKNLSQLITKLYELKNNIISDFDIKIINEVSSEISLSSIDSINIFRVVQEAIQNSIKHSKSDKIKIQFSDFGRGFKLEIIDYGVGFDISNTEYGNGINNMKYRCKEANGDFFIKSNSFGTVITCSFSF